jgi:Arc/MetJ-type ribon-helix-helix transcriptional regulator
MTSTMLSVRLDAGTLRLVDTAVKTLRKSRSAVVRDALRRTLGAPLARSPIEVVADRVGCADSGRGDLAQNHSSILKERLRARAARAG